MKKFIALLLALVFVLSFAACGSNDKVSSPSNLKTDSGAKTDAVGSPKADLTMGTGGESGTYYAFGGVVAGFIGDKTDVNITVVSTGGTKANITGIDDGTYDLATVQSDVSTYAYNGTNSFAETGAVKSFSVLGALYAETVQMVTCNPDIKSVADFKGKNVCVGDIGSGTYFNTIDVLAAYGMTLDDINPVYQSFGASTESLKDGKIDVAFLCAGAPTTAVTDLATAKDTYLVSIDDEHMTKLLADCPWYAALTIPAGTYKGFDQDTSTITVKCTLVARANLPEDVAYAIVSTIFDNQAAIAELHGKGAELSLEFATDGIAIPFNKGAAKYFSEHGITVTTAD
ncbi:MAG: TAXI family TRAP transporter solute-binding subunit [Oscillospiraceae bacterium]|nr:TAXI family TRAP transporter solute-binding subunit [Oscillospiraceae bacterium]